MKFIIAFAFIAVVAADVSHLPSNEYLPPLPSNEYLPPVQGGQGIQAAPAPVFNAPIGGGEPAPAHTLGADGYQYKNPARRFRYRY